MNYFAARLVRQFKASGAYPSVLPPSPAPGVSLARERGGRGWRGAVVGNQPRPGREKELLLSPWVVAEKHLCIAVKARLYISRPDAQMKQLNSDTK